MAGQSRESGQSVASKLVRILEAFTTQRPRRNLAEIARAAEMPAATVHRLLGQLVEFGAVERSRDGRYSIGLKLWEIGVLSPRASQLRTTALPCLEYLFEATHGTVSLVIPDRDEALFVEVIPGKRAENVPHHVGQRVPLLGTAPSRVLLAFAPPATVERVLVGEPPAELQGIRQMISQVHRARLARCAGARGSGTVTVAAPVFGPEMRVPAAVSVELPLAAEGRLVAVLQTAARGISAELGTRRILRPVPAVGAHDECAPRQTDLPLSGSFGDRGAECGQT